MKISIIGLGWYGEPLGLALKKSGHEIIGTTRTLSKLGVLKKQSLSAACLDYPSLPQEDLLNSEVIILNIPPFEKQLDWFKSWNWNKDSWIIFISSTSNKPMLLEIETWFQTDFPHWTILRFGGLLGKDRHPGKSLSGKKDIKGRLLPVNLIHLDDAIGFIQTIIDKKITNKIFNVVSDEHRSKEEFYSNYCRLNGLPLPEFDLTDNSKGKLVSNKELKEIYSLKRPLL